MTYIMIIPHVNLSNLPIRTGKRLCRIPVFFLVDHTTRIAIDASHHRI